MSNNYEEMERELKTVAVSANNLMDILTRRGNERAQRGRDYLFTDKEVEAVHRIKEVMDQEWVIIYGEGHK